MILTIRRGRPGDVRERIGVEVLAEREVWVAERGDGVVLGLLVLDGEVVEQLQVEPGATGGGIGTALLEVAKRERPDGLRLRAPADGGARRFYERHDFRADDGEVTTDLPMVWEPVR